tara:strand:- start:606 stop:1469 length:864 start_codon:yes stop_codon:yes gene_type:complete
MSKVYITTCATLDTEVFYHWLNYYSDKVDDFFINLWGDSSIINFEEIISIMKEFGIETYLDCRDQHTFNEDYKTSLFNRTMSKKPNDWWIPVDCDEFIHFDYGIKNEIKHNEENNYDYTFGLLLDRVSSDGKLIEVKTTDDIFEIFPLVGNVAMVLKGYESWVDKVSLCRGDDIRLLNGLHGIKKIKRKKISDRITQHHHFKWTSNTLKNVKLQYEGLESNSHGWFREYENLLSYLEKNDGLDVNDAKFLLSEWNGKYLYWDKFLEIDRQIKSSKEYPNKKNIWERS